METILNKVEKEEAERFIENLKKMTKEEKIALLHFMEGLNAAQAIQRSTERARSRKQAAEAGEEPQKEQKTGGGER
ncbi:MAG: hypothetical protein Q4C60_02055 [Eubacteriales bacterium]|nr:hypothetical protein [Eubacteriales bacterium]